MALSRGPVTATCRDPVTAEQFHQNFANMVAFGEDILWDAYRPDQYDVFLKKLIQLIPDQEGTTTMQKRRELLFKQTIEQTKYTNKQLLANFILVTVANGTTHNDAKNATEYSVTLLIRTRKCFSSIAGKNCCIIFIDQEGNVYQNWNHFMQTNVLPEGIALAPANGVYTFKDEKLILDSWMTPNSKIVRQALKLGDIAATGGGTLLAAVGIASLCVTVAPVVLAASTVAGFAVGGYSGIRSAANLISRAEHEQSIHITDPNARGDWLGIATGVVAAGAAGATSRVASLAAGGREVSMASRSLVNGLNISTILLSGGGICNGIFDLLMKYWDGETISTLSVAQLAASLIIFTHSTYNFQLAETIINKAQSSRIYDYRNESSRAQRKMFDKLSKETIRIKGESAGKTEIVRMINEIPDKQYLNDLHKINKNLNKANVRFSAGSDGKILLNNEVPVQPSVLRNSVQHGVGPNVLNEVKGPIPSTYQPILQTNEFKAMLSLASEQNNIQLLQAALPFIQQAIVIINNGESCINCITAVFKRVGSVVAQYIMEKCAEFLSYYKRELESILERPLPFEEVLWNFFNEIIRSFEDITVEQIESQLKILYDKIYLFYKRISFHNTSVERVNCTACGGWYKISQ